MLLARARELAEGRSWRELCAFLLDQDPLAPGPGLVVQAIDAALAESDPAALQWALRHAVEGRLPHRGRAAVALRLARGGHPEQGWAVLQADPAAIEAPEVRWSVLAALAVMAASKAATPERRRSALSLHARLLAQEGVPPEATSIRFPAAAALAPPAFPLVVRYAPTADPEAPAAIERHLAQKEIRLAQEATPVVQVYRDVAINRLGHLWRAGRRESDATAPSVPAGVRAVGGTNNLYHWLGAWLPSIAWRFMPGAPADLPILLRSDARRFQLESLELLGGPDLPIVQVGAACRVGALYDVDNRAVRLDPAGGIEPVIARLIAAAEARVPDPPVRAERLYISRRDAASRPMANEAELEARLAALGFTSVMLTPYTLSESIAIIRAARVIAAPHGAGLSHLLLARPGTAVFELMPFNEEVLHVRLCMARLSRLRGHRHLLWVERREQEGMAWHASIPEAVAAIEAFLRSDAAGPGIPGFASP